MGPGYRDVFTVCFYCVTPAAMNSMVHLYSHFGSESPGLRTWPTCLSLLGELNEVMRAFTTIQPWDSTVLKSFITQIQRWQRRQREQPRRRLQLADLMEGSVPDTPDESIEGIPWPGTIELP